MAQLVARGVWDAEVAGSSPVAPTMIVPILFPDAVVSSLP